MKLLKKIKAKFQKTANKVETKVKDDATKLKDGVGEAVGETMFGGDR